MGPLIIISGPAGSGKSTIIRRLLEEKTWPMRLSVSVTTRAPRPKEVEGVHYYFRGKDFFEEEIKAKAFLEWAEVFGNYYGTLKSEIEPYRLQDIGVLLDIDVKGYFDSIDWSLLLKAVRTHTDCPWVLLYIERWLKAPVRMEDGSVVPRTAGTPQGGVISPILANLFLHYAFDMWMTRTFPAIPFERYADDCICHCRSEAEARALDGGASAYLLKPVDDCALVEAITAAMAHPISDRS